MSSVTSVARLRVAHDRAGFDAREVAREIVPRRVEAAGVEEAVEASGRDLAQAERGGTERPELLPRQRAAAVAR